MHRMISAFLTLLVCAACGIGDTTATQQHGTARTYFESLDLSSPQASAETFTDAFQRDDYMTVWMVLHTESQFRFVSHWNLLDYDRLFDTERLDPAVDVPPLFSLETWEHQDPWWSFDQVMLAET